MACTSASVSFRESLKENELVLALLTGRVPRRRRAHFHVLLGEAPGALLKGLVDDVGEWTTPGRVEGNLLRIAETLGESARVRKWFKPG
jgi:hypothetical protein